MREATWTRSAVAAYLARLKVDDPGWALGPETLFVRNAAAGFYDELAKGQ